MTATLEPTTPNPSGAMQEHRIVLDDAEIKAEMERRANLAQADVRVPGFRPGKASTAAIVQQHGDQLRSEAENQLLARKLQEEVKHNVDVDRVLGNLVVLEVVAGAATATVGEPSPEGSVVFSLRYDSCPEVPDIDLGQIQLTRSNYKITDEDVQQWLKRTFTVNPLRGDSVPGRSAQFGDAVLVKFVAKVGQEEVFGSSEREIMTRAGMSRISPEVNLALMGAKAGDLFRYRQTLAADHPVERFRGKSLVHELKVLEVTPVLPAEPSEALAKAAGCESLPQLMEQCRRQAENFARQLARTQLHEQFRLAIADANRIELPPQAVWQSALHERQGQRGAYLSAEITQDDLDDADLSLRFLAAQLALVRRRQIQVTEDQLARVASDWLNPLPPTNEQILQLRKQFEADPTAQNQLRLMAEREILLDLALQEGRVTDQTVEFATISA